MQFSNAPYNKRTIYCQYITMYSQIIRMNHDYLVEKLQYYIKRGLFKKVNLLRLKTLKPEVHLRSNCTVLYCQQSSVYYWRAMKKNWQKVTHLGD